MARNNTSMIVLAIIIVALLFGLGTGVLDSDMLNIQPEDRSSISSEEIEERESPMDKFMKQLEESKKQSSSSLLIMVLMITLIFILFIKIGFIVMKTSKSFEKLDDTQKELQDSIQKAERGYEFRSPQDTVMGKYRWGTRKAPTKRAREIYGSNDNLHVKLVKESLETGRINPPYLQQKKINNKSEDEIQSVLCPKCKKVHIQTDEEGCWFCNYKWGDIIERKEY